MKACQVVDCNVPWIFTLSCIWCMFTVEGHGNIPHSEGCQVCWAKWFATARNPFFSYSFRLADTYLIHQQTVLPSEDCAKVLVILVRLSKGALEIHPFPDKSLNLLTSPLELQTYQYAFKKILQCLGSANMILILLKPCTLNILL